MGEKNQSVRLELCAGDKFNDLFAAFRQNINGSNHKESGGSCGTGVFSENIQPRTSGGPGHIKIKQTTYKFRQYEFNSEWFLLHFRLPNEVWWQTQRIRVSVFFLNQIYFRNFLASHWKRFCRFPKSENRRTLWSYLIKLYHNQDIQFNDKLRICRVHFKSGLISTKDGQEILDPSADPQIFAVKNADKPRLGMNK